MIFCRLVDAVPAPDFAGQRRHEGAETVGVDVSTAVFAEAAKHGCLPAGHMPTDQPAQRVEALAIRR